MQKISSIHNVILEFHEHVCPKITQITFSFPKFILACKKNQLILSIHPWDTAILECYELSGHIHFWPCTPKTFSVNMNLYQYAENQAILSICSGDRANLKILQSNWLKAFWTISQKPHFTQIWDFYYSTNGNQIFQ